jgi:hypothetical protein
VNQGHKTRLIEISQQLVEEGRLLVTKEYSVGSMFIVPTKDFYKWLGKVVSFGQQLGVAARPWKAMLTDQGHMNYSGTAAKILGTLEAILHELENDHLDSFTTLVKAETLADLLEQAEHLFANGYVLAAGVIGRAVLEQHLRDTCDTLGCLPEKDRPTLNDFNQALYSFDHYNKIKMKAVDALAAIGNDAAHNKEGLEESDVKRLLSDLPGVLESTSV